MGLTQHQLSVVLDLLAANLASLALDLTLLDEAGGAVLHAESDSEHLLVLTACNTSDKPVVIHALQGAPTDANANFSIKLTNNSFYFRSPPQVSPGTSHPWEAGHDDIGNGYLTQIFLSTTQELTLLPGDTFTIKLAYQWAYAATRTAVTVSGEVIVTDVTVDGVAIPGHQDFQLDLLEDANVPNPLLAALAGPRTVLNDGQTVAQVKIVLTNPSPGPLSFETPAIQGGETPTCFRIRVPLANQVDADWALCTTDEAAGLSLMRPSSEQGKWTIAAPQGSATEKSWVVRPVYASNPSFPAEDTLPLTLKAIKSSLAPGFVAVLVDLIDFPVYGTQTRVVELEKSPLIYRPTANQGLLTAGTKGANTALEIQGDTTKPTLAVTQKGAGAAAVFTGGDAERLQVGSFDTKSDSYVAVRVATGSLYRSGVELDVSSKDYRFTIEHDDREPRTSGHQRGLNIIRQHGGNSEPKSALFVQRDNGNVGIGTTKPQAKLQVAGDFTVANPKENATDSMMVWFPAAGGGTLDIRNWESGWNIQNTTAGKHLYIGRDSASSSNLFLGRQNREVMIEGATGNVGIGTTAPQVSLHVAGEARLKGIGFQQDVKDVGMKAFIGLAENADGKMTPVRLGGERGIAFYNNLQDCLARTNYGVKPPDMWLDESALHLWNLEVRDKLTFKKGATVSGHLTASGNVEASGDVNAGGDMAAAGYVHANGNVYASGYLCCLWGGDWKYINHSGNSWTGIDGPSDRTLKKEIHPIKGALEKVQSLHGVRFRWNEYGIRHLIREADSYCAGPGATAEEDEQVRQAKRRELAEQLSGVQMGLIAQEVEAVAPEVVHQDGGGYLNVDYDRLVALLVEAIKEQKALFDAQAEEIRALNARLDALAGAIA